MATPRIHKITEAGPVHDRREIDAVVAVYTSAEPPVAYATNSLPRTWPIGLDLEWETTSGVIPLGDAALLVLVSEQDIERAAFAALG